MYHISRKLIELDDEAEAKGLCFLTYEQIINDIKFTYFHLYCKFYDSKYLCLSDQDKEEFAKSNQRMEFFKDKSICIEWMLLEANEVAKEKIEYALLELLDNKGNNRCNIILSNMIRRMA